MFTWKLMIPLAVFFTLLIVKTNALDCGVTCPPVNSLGSSYNLAGFVFRYTCKFGNWVMCHPIGLVIFVILGIIGWLWWESIHK